MADDFCRFFDAMMEKYTLRVPNKRKYHRDGTLSKAEVMVIIILFHNSGYRCLKHFYLEYVSKHLRHLFPELVSYNRFVELEKDVAIPLALFIKKGVARQMYRYQLRGQHAAEGLQEPAHPHPQDLQGYCAKGQMLYGMVLWIQTTSYL